MTHRFLILISLTVLLCLNLFGQSKDDSLYVFVGKKVSIKKATQPKLKADQIRFYTKYKLKFKVVQNIYNKLEEKTVIFYSAAHLGMRELPTSDYSLLFLSNKNGQYNLIRFQFFDVYQTKDGRWASCGDPFYSDEQFKDSLKTTIPVGKLNYKKPVTFKVNPSLDSAKVKEVFPEPYFKVEGQTATGLMGSYVDDLFIIKKEGVLKKLGYFK